MAISAKRYALLRDENGEPVLLQKGVNNHEDRWSEDGLGHLRNPYDFESEDRDWIQQVWLYIIRMALRLPTEPLSFEAIPASFDKDRIASLRGPTSASQVGLRVM